MRIKDRIQAMHSRTILISGAGIAGPTLAYWLKRAGFEPTLVESAPSLRTGGYVIDFWGLGYDIAERMGLSGEIEHVGYHIREMRIVDGAGKRIAGFGTAVFNELTGGRFVTLARSDLSRLLFAKLGSETIFGDEIVGLEQQDEFVQVQFRRTQERRFDLVIGADGLHSKVRSLAFGPQGQLERQLGYCVAAFEIRGYRPRDDDVYMIYSRPGRMLGRFALHDDRTLILFVFAAPVSFTPSMFDVRAQKALLRERFGDGAWETTRILKEMDQTETFYFDRVSQIRMERWSRGRVALVGDAAFCVSLMAGQGSALAMIGAYVMAGELAKVDGRYAEAFGSYETLLRSFIETKQKAAERFSSAFAPKTRSGVFLRNQVIRMCAIPGLARVAFGRVITDGIRLPNYRWV